MGSMNPVTLENSWKIDDVIVITGNVLILFWYLQALCLAPYVSDDFLLFVTGRRFCIYENCILTLFLKRRPIANIYYAGTEHSAWSLVLTENS
jgi:hypothetical protein